MGMTLDLSRAGNSVSPRCSISSSVPLTIGLALLSAIMQDERHTGTRYDEDKHRQVGSDLSRLLASSFLINFAIGVVTRKSSRSSSSE